MLLFAVFLLALLSIALSVATPVIIRQIQLDRERETMERGKQYRRAVQLYFRKFHTYPPTVDALVMTNNIRFLRKRYLDPMTGKDDWLPILFGQNKAPTVMGFFGQPLSGAGPIGGSTVAGIGPSGGNSGAMAEPALTGGSDSPFSNQPGSSAGGVVGPSNTVSTGSTQGSTSGSGQDSNGATFSGAGIIGFSPGSTNQSIMLFKNKDRYNEWEFTYDPIGDPTFVQGNAVTNQFSANSVVGVGTGPNGTGPVIGPNPGSTATDNTTQ